METSILNKLSPEGRKRVIELEGQIRKIDEEIIEIDNQIQNLDAGTGLLD